jgi:hypothetical protein
MVSAMTLAMVSTRNPVRTQKSVIDDVIRREQAGQRPATSTGAPGQMPAASQTQPQAPSQTQTGAQTGAQTGQKASPGAGVVPTQSLPPGGTTGQTQGQTQPPASQQDPSKTDAKSTGGR